MKSLREKSQDLARCSCLYPAFYVLSFPKSLSRGAFSGHVLLHVEHKMPTTSDIRVKLRKELRTAVEHDAVNSH